MSDAANGPAGPRVLEGIAPTAWEHPADQAALAALRRIPAFDEVLRQVFGFFGERPVRLAFQANAVRVSDRQFPELHDRYLAVLRTLDAPAPYPLFVTQTPVVNAGAYGMQKPFIVLNSAALRLLEPDEQTFLLGHEVGHVMSGHVLYRTMTVLLIRLAQLGFPIVGLAARGVLMALLEWSRKSELSADRAGLLAVQNPETAFRTSMRLAGGGTSEEMDLNAFLEQAEEYRDGGDIADSVFKVINLLFATHPFHVLRAAELRTWIEAGAYDRIVRGEYERRSDEPHPYLDDLTAAARAYQEDAKPFVDRFGKAVDDAARRVREAFAQGFGAP